MPLRYLIPTFMIVLSSLASCAYMSSPPLSLMSDARMEVALAEQVEAPTFASREMDEARMLLSQADRFLKEGDEKQAKRLAERALLTARYARTLASYRKLKRKLDKEEIELQTLQRELEAARVKREAAEAELRRLRGKEAER